LLSLGWALIGLGIVGLFLPVLQGMLFLLAGLAVLSRESATARRLFRRMRRRYPKADARLHELGKRVRHFFRRFRSDPQEPEEETTSAGMKTGSSDPRSTTEA
jgi:hypothetical protein